jgi:putative autoinducer-2 (AI-2) aldolase
MLAVDHGYFLGPLKKLEKVDRTVKPLLSYADALMLTRGILRASVASDIDVPIVLRVSGGNSIVGKHLSDEALTVSIEECLRLNVCAAALSIYVGAEHEHRTLVNLARLVDEAQRYGIPVLAVTAVGKELEKRDARYLSLACRIAAELGAHFVKTYYCEEFEKVAESCPVPLVIAGGPKLNTELDAFRMAFEAVARGAKGVDMGRNIWQNEKPVSMIKAVRAVVHENVSPEEALSIYREKE